MFTIERTDIRPAFGYTIEDVLDYLQDLDEIEEQEYALYERTHLHDPKDLLSANQFAIKLLEQKPEYVSEEGLFRNSAEGALYLHKKHKMPNFEYLISYMANENIKNLDTYLHDVDVSKLNLITFTELPNAFPFIRKYLDRYPLSTILEHPIRTYFSKNTEALDFLEEHPEKIHFYHLCANKNPRAIAILRENLDKILWDILSSNPCDAAIDLLLEHPDRIDYNSMCFNPNPRAIVLVYENLHRIDYFGWRLLSRNPCKKATELLAANPDKIYWKNLCSYASTKEQFDLIRDNLDTLDEHEELWDDLCTNSSEYAVEILEENPECVNWTFSLMHQNIFETITEYDYEGIREARHDLHQEFHAWAGHPSKMMTKWRDWGFDVYDFDEEESENSSW